MSEPASSSPGGSLAVRVVLGAVVVFVALTVVGWVVGALLAILRAAVVLVAVAVVIWLVVVGRRD